MDLELFKKCVLSFRVIDYNTDMSYFQKVDVFLKKLGTQCIQQLIPSYKQLQELSGEKPGLCGSLLVDNLDQAYLKKLITSTEKSSTPAPYLFFTPEGIIERNRKYHDSHLDPEAEKKFGLNAM